MAESYHDRRLARRLKEDPEFRAEFERQRGEIARIDSSARKLRFALSGSAKERGGRIKAAIKINRETVRRLAK